MRCHFSLNFSRSPHLTTSAHALPFQPQLFAISPPHNECACAAISASTFRDLPTSQRVRMRCHFSLNFSRSPILTTSAHALPFQPQLFAISDPHNECACAAISASTFRDL